MAQKREKEEKQITDMLCAAEVRLEDLPFTVKGGKTNGSAGVIRAYSMTGEEQIDSIDTIVNSASPDLMGGKENTVENFLKNNKKTVEGVRTAKIVHRVASKHGIDMPICEEVYQILFEGKEPKTCASDLMLRELKREF